MRSFVVLLIVIYRGVFSRLKLPVCRFFPSCSLYALQAIRRYGLYKGGLRSLRRLLRCNPFCSGGYDPVD